MAKTETWYASYEDDFNGLAVDIDIVVHVPEGWELDRYDLESAAEVAFLKITDTVKEN